jgi:hypothetical protein
VDKQPPQSRIARSQILKVLVLVSLLFPAASTAQIATGSISGLVVTGKESTPVPDARVTLVNLKSRVILTEKPAMTDSAGRFFIDNVPDGQYSVGVTHAGMVRASSDNTVERIIVTVGSQRETKSYVAIMSPETVVEGHVTDPDGKPSAGAQIRIYYNNNREQGSFGRVDKDGDFHVVVSPGRLTLSADFDPAETDVVKTYYPGVLSSNAAVNLDVLEGEVRRDVDFRMLPAVKVRVSGHATGPYSIGSMSGHAFLEPQEPLQNTQKFFPNVELHNSPGRNALEFQFEDVLSGSYNLFIVIAEADGRFNLGKQAVTVESTDLHDLSVAVHPGTDVHGQIVFQGIPAPGFSDMRVAIYPENMPDRIRTAMDLGKVTFTSNTDFIISDVPDGEYSLFLYGAPAGTALISTRQGAVSKNDSSFKVSGSTTESLLLAVGKAGTISGRIVDGDHNPTPTVPIVLLPSKEVRSKFTRYRRAVADGDGLFHFDDIAPGDYTVISIGANSQSDFERNEYQGYPVSVTPGSSTTIDVPFLGIMQIIGVIQK